MIASAAPPAPTTPPPPASPKVDEIYNSVINLLVIASEFIQRLIWPVLLLIGSLLKNDILFGGGMEDRMLAIWVVIRNFVNILFVLVLLGIALYNVAGGKAQDYHLKAILPKFIIALIVVNFSFAMVKVAVDAVNVLSTAIFALPMSVEEGFGTAGTDPNVNNIFASAPDYEAQICSGLYGKELADYTPNVSNASAAGGFVWCNADAQTLTSDAKLFFNKFDGNNAGMILAINMMKLNSLDKVQTGQQASLKDLFVNIIFSTALFIVYGTAFIALFCVLLVRLVVIWMGMVLSPLMVLPAVLPESLKASMGGGDISKKFIQNVIVPIPVSVVMTLGFILLTGLQKSSFPGVVNNASSSSVRLLLSGYSTLQELIVAVGTVAFLWIGIFKAMEGTAAQKLVDGVKNTVSGIGKFAVGSLKYAPLFPVQVGQGGSGGDKPVAMSLAGMQAGLRKFQQGREQGAEKEAEILVGREQKAKLFQAEKLAREGKVKQALDAAGSSMAGQKDNAAMKEIGLQMKKDPSLRTNYDWTVDVLSKDKKRVLKPEEVVDLMSKGKGDEMDAESFEKWRLKNKETAPPVAEDKSKAGAGKPGQGFSAEKGADAIKYGAPYMSSLNKDEKKAVDDFNKAKDDSAKAKIAEGANFQSAVGKLRAGMNDAIGPAKMDKFASGTDLENALTARRKALVDSYMAGGKKEADAVAEADKTLATEMGKVDTTKYAAIIKDSPSAQKYITAGKAAPAGPPAKPGAPGAPAKPGAPPPPPGPPKPPAPPPKQPANPGEPAKPALKPIPGKNYNTPPGAKYPPAAHKGQTIYNEDNSSTWISDGTKWTKVADDYRP